MIWVYVVLKYENSIRCTTVTRADLLTRHPRTTNQLAWRQLLQQPDNTDLGQWATRRQNTSWSASVSREHFTWLLNVMSWRRRRQQQLFSLVIVVVLRIRMSAVELPCYTWIILRDKVNVWVIQLLADDKIGWCKNANCRKCVFWGCSAVRCQVQVSNASDWWFQAEKIYSAFFIVMYLVVSAWKALVWRQ